MNSWIGRIDKTTNEFIHTFGSLTDNELNWKPNPETWSIAQNIDHLIIINQSYFPILSLIKSPNYKPPFIAKLGFIVNFLGKSILKSVHPDRNKKMRTFSIWEPTTSHKTLDILKKFNNHQTELKKEILASRDLIKNKVIISSPANKNVVYTLETAFEIIVTHEQRHLEQAKEVLKLLPQSTPMTQS
ncbi:DinB family protein [Aquimarina sediminis]|uniref:DinB family protein n=1 Tax=Aquimarina sediminis TaxID=2070536 RepID=UPI000CA04960|nr:DinB family protein [Aquimarina sediminis]